MWQHEVAACIKHSHEMERNHMAMHRIEVKGEYEHETCGYDKREA